MPDTLLRSAIPLAAAPMAGGPSCPELARAVASAGAFPFIAGGYRSAPALAAEIDEVGASTAAFGVNLFVPSTGVVDRREFARYASELAEASGVDGLIVQGPAAGGHSATFDGSRAIVEITTGELVRRIRRGSRLPIIAAGGVDGPRAVQALLNAGAEGVAVGTMLLRADEAGTSLTHRTALADPAFIETAITHAFTGRPARALRNGCIDRHEAGVISAYPAVHHLTRPIRAAAAALARRGSARARSSPALTRRSARSAAVAARLVRRGCCGAAARMAQCRHFREHTGP